MQTTFSSKNQKTKVRRMIQCALAGAALSLAMYPHIARADVNLSPYDGYDITQHADGGFANPIPGYGDVEDSTNNAFPLSEFESGNYNSTLYKELTVDVGNTSNGSDDYLYDLSLNSQLNGQSDPLSLRQALGIANNTGTPTVIYFNSSHSYNPPLADSAGITSDITNQYLNGAVNLAPNTGYGPLIVDNPNADIVFYSHNFFLQQAANTGWPTGVNPLLEVNAGKVLFYATNNSPSYAEFPISIGGTGPGADSGQVTVYVTHREGWDGDAAPIINVLNMSSYGVFKVNRFTRVNLEIASTPTTLNDYSSFELGQTNTVYNDLDLYDHSTLISNGGNTYYYFGGNHDRSGNTFQNVTLNDSSNAVFGYKTSITKNLTVNDSSTVRLLGPSFVTGTATFGANSTVVATLNTPITPSLDPFQQGVPDYSDSAYDPNNVGNTRALLTVGGALTVDDGAKLVIDSVNSNSLSVGQKYLIFTSANPSGLLNFNHNISTSLTPLTFSGLTEDTGNNSSNYYVSITGIDFANSFDDVTGGNKEQRNFFNYIRDIAPNNNPGNVNAALLNLYNNLGSGPGYNYNAANSFLGDTYTAHAAQLYWNQQSFLNEITDHLGSNRNLNFGGNTFNLASGNANSAQSQLFSLSQSLNTPSSGLAGVLNADGNNNLGNSGVWADAYGGRVNTKDDSSLGTPNWDSSTTGFAAGYTGGSDHFNYGVAVGHQKSDLSFNDRMASGDMDGYNAGLYAALNHRKSYLNGMLSYSHFDNDASRTDAIGDDSSSFNSHGFAAKLEYGLHVHQTKTSDFTPYASLAWTKSDRGAITEEGTGAGLTLNSNSNSIETTQLGVRYNHRTYNASGTLKGGIQAGVAWVHQFGDTDFPTSAQFTGTTGSFDIYNTPLSSNAAQVQLGAYGRVHKNVIGFVNYQGTFGGNEHVNSITGGLGYQF